MKIPVVVTVVAALALLPLRRKFKRGSKNKSSDQESSARPSVENSAPPQSGNQRTAARSDERGVAAESVTRPGTQVTATAIAPRPTVQVPKNEWPAERDGDQAPTTPRMGLEVPPIPEEQQARIVNSLQNEALAHELILNPEFQLGEGSGNPMQKQVEGVMKRAYWDMFRQRTSEGDFQVVTDNLKDIKQKLHALIPEKRIDMHEALDRNFDFEFVREQIEHRAFDVESLQHIIHVVMDAVLQLESPARTEETKEWLKEMKKNLHESPEEWETKLPEIFEFVSKKLDQISLDIANWQVRIASDWLQHHGVRFEQDKFDARLEAGAVSLDVTARWAAAAPSELSTCSYVSDSDKTICTIADTVEERQAFLFHRYGVFQLLQSNTPLTQQTCPEILWMDLPRLVEAQNTLQALTLIGALMMINLSLLSEKGVHPTADEVKMFKGDVKKLLSHPQSHIRLLVDYMQRFFAKLLKEHKQEEPTESDNEFVKRMVEKTTSTEDPFYKTMNTKVLRVLWETLRLQEDEAVRKVVEDQRLSVKEEMLEACIEMRKVLTHNYSVHERRLPKMFEGNGPSLSSSLTTPTTEAPEQASLQGLD
mmetsp:Transcript_25804/g.31283  ORF Transcript_25804/g.31283 Transcript_25804/m.31283 type:complete len:593 (-) Transcript_25804:316-2094(-)|eukprot:CAMPEP_0197865986 /NCGR_PEP_ID=MMETSP1438-20131217/43967_1 /TAXON_ID=1461541 /ORGANISM="Pterosperma sp., Strain CCMP1384" /LENGTH=592 /DNA_ID=CAMNT_0043484511 /DNA_START=182 /DNA_END=1960 /DNA_ORIENTATION=+